MDDVIKRLTKERDEARAERDQALCRQEDLEADVRYYEDRWERIIGGAYQRGAEAMREHIAEVAWRNAALEWFVELVRALPIPEET